MNSIAIILPFLQYGYGMGLILQLLMNGEYQKEWNVKQSNKYMRWEYNIITPTLSFN